MRLVHRHELSRHGVRPRSLACGRIVHALHKRCARIAHQEAGEKPANEDAAHARNHRPGSLARTDRASSAPASASSDGRRRRTTCSWNPTTIPIYRDIGVSKVQNLPLAPWPRLGGRGSYIQLHGTEGKWGSYVVEVPGAGALNAEKHIYEEIYLVVEGRGSTEVWLDGEHQAPRVRMAEGLAVLDSGQRHAPHRQCQFGAGAAAWPAPPRRT